MSSTPASALATSLPAARGPFAAAGPAARMMRLLLFLTVLASPFVFVEPSPYEGVVLLLGIGSFACGVTLDRRALPLLILMLAWSISGVFALIPVMNDDKAVQYLAVAIYLQMTAVLFACIFSGDTLRRVATLRTAYILAAVLAATLGILGYFRLVPGSDLLIENNRARATFKDPNVFGPFLILPLLFLVQGILYRGFRLRYVIAGGVILSALFLTFSRGAWGHFVVSAAMMMFLMFATAPTPYFRARILAFAIVTAVAVAGLLAVLLSFEAVSGMFTQRANLAQTYDVGQGGRFGRQVAGIEAVLNHPNGLGPEQFGKRHRFGQDPHNVYLNAFVSFGWIGGIAYLAIVLITLAVGFRAVRMPTPWQPYLIAVYATFVGLVAEGLIIDTDHWRHFYLILGLIWGMMIAAEKARRSTPRPSH